MPGVTAIVLAGGGSSRFGADKLSQPLGGATVLDALISGLPPTWAVVAVGPERPTVRQPTWAVEDHPGGGPVAGLAAGLTLVETDLVVVLAGDMPFVGAWAARLADELAGRQELDAVAASHSDGRPNPLFAAYRCGALRRVLPPDPRNQAARPLLLALAHATITIPEQDLLDVDTPEALEAARHRLGS